MFKQVGLSKKQESFIRKLAVIELDMLNKMQKGNIDNDLALYLIEHEMSHDEYLNFIEIRKKVFWKVLEEPQQLFSLDDDEISIIKTIMTSMVKSKKFDEVKRELWKKFNLKDKLNQYHSLN